MVCPLVCHLHLFAVLFVDCGFLRVARFTQSLQICRVEPGPAIVDRDDMVDLGGGDAITGLTDRINGENKLAKLLPGAIVAPLGGRKLPGRFLAPRGLAVAMNRTAQDHG